MSGLINIAQRRLGTEAVETVNARDLHVFLENGDRFTTWIRDRIEQYGFVEGVDYTTFSENPEKGRPRIEYALSLDMGKELAMVERNDKGKQARQYFIECERAAKGSSSPTHAPRIDSAIHALKLAPLAVRAARAFGLDKNAAAISANQYVCAVTGENLLQNFGSTHLPAERQDTQWFTPTELSPEAQVSARKLNEALAAAGLQERRGKAWELTPTGHAFARLFDTGKKHNSGTMVQQVKWSPAVLQELRKTGSLI
jgi:phage anti-repressor protein